MRLRTLFALAAGAALAGTAGAADLPVVNGGFEASATEAAGWEASQHAGEAAYEMVIDDHEPAAGEHSFRIKRLGEQVYGMISQHVPLPKDAGGGTLHYSAMLRTRDVGSGGWLLLANFLGPGGEILGQVRSTPLRGTAKWQRVTLSKPVPKNARTVQAALMLLDGGTGWADDLRLSVEAAEAH